MITFDQSPMSISNSVTGVCVRICVCVCVSVRKREIKNRGQKLQLIIYIYKIHIHYIFLSNLHYLSAGAKTIRVTRERRMKNEISIHMCGRRVVIREQEYIESPALGRTISHYGTNYRAG